MNDVTANSGSVPHQVNPTGLDIMQKVDSQTDYQEP
jgi:hypothetical protein